ncbi:MAG: hypothetical protein K0V04_19230 [Deltaproteobacteria bacterium]|nr:hypothetical protein [Deltaproteobacteria bacterium]
MKLIEGLMLQITRWRPTAVEDEQPHAARAVALPWASRLIARSRSTLERVERSSSFPKVARTELVPMGLCELAELERKLDQLEPHAPTWRLVDVCARTQGRLSRIFGVMHRVLCDYEQVERARPWDELEQTQALQSRRILAALWSGVRQAGDIHDPTTRLRRAAMALSEAVSARYYRDLRIGDRVLLQEIQRELLRWLDSERDARDGEHIWQDLMGFVELTRGINRRQELIDHDRKTARVLAHALPDLSPEQQLPEELWSRARTLRGWHQDVDPIVRCGRATTVAQWSPLLPLLQQHCGVSEPMRRAETSQYAAF